MQNTLAALLLIGGIYVGALAAVLAVVASGDRGILARPGTAVEGAADVEIDEATALEISAWSGRESAWQVKPVAPSSPTLAMLSCVQG